MINTADSMIGHLNDRYRHFGRFAAKLDDVANYIPARLTGLLAALATALTRSKGAAKAALSVMRSDARLHRSPNAGWPESAFAGALDLALAGPRQYGEEKVEGPMLNASGKREAEATDIDAALDLFWATMSLMTGLLIAASIVGLIV
jgi:adenosylcobinamide-phosphate synthase